MVHATLFARNIPSLRHKIASLQWRWHSTAGCSHLQERILDENMKLEIEKHWRDKLTFKTFDRDNTKDKFYVLSMFPYPSGSLHMGHVRVYSISDAIARFYRLQGKNVFHPMGFDAFGLPAENAAIQRNIPADQWTRQNIAQMKQQLHELGCSFDWSAELATCDAAYYKWTQKLFLMLFADGLAYQCESLVNWDPIDQTVLADEQVDESGCSWRSGAKVEKRLLRQWFIKTTKFAEQLYDGLSDPLLRDWRDIVVLQKHWIGECDGWNFTLQLDNEDEKITVWSNTPEDFKDASFVAIKREHLLNKEKIDEGLLKAKASNPFGPDLPIIVTSNVEYPPFNEVHLGVPSKRESDMELARKYNLDIKSTPSACEADRTRILERARELKMGAEFKISSKLRDWLISRQRFWGTPIPIIHCIKCGAVPVPEKDLPIKLPEMVEDVGKPLSRNEKWLRCSCPKCGGEARRESDTMDTFVDSSWYFLRYLDANNPNDLVDKSLAQKMMPVDLYIGGKEHAVLHLYYARFINHFLHEKGYVSHREPFERLLVQGMVKGKTYRVKETGQYLRADEIEVVDEKKEEAIAKDTGRSVEVMWEKMSKSKFNGVDPMDVMSEHSSDTARLIILADVTPMSHRNWSEATFPGVINWQKRLWMTVHDFQFMREKSGELTRSQDFDEHEKKLLDSLNLLINKTTFAFKVTHQLSSGISRMQSLTSSIRRMPSDVIAFSEQYERALGAQIIMLAPLAPHFASELWSRFISTPGRVCDDSQHIDWNADVFDQKWPRVDPHFKIDFTVKVNSMKAHIFQISFEELNKMDKEEAMRLAFDNERIVKRLKNKPILISDWYHCPDFEASLNLVTDLNSIEKHLRSRAKSEDE